MANIKNSISKFDRTMSAITFAEAGERERALDILYDGPEQVMDKRIESGLTKREKTRADLRKRKVMNRNPKKTSLWRKTFVYGLLSVGLYTVTFTQADLVMKYFTRGAWYAALPIATVFIFSFAHGAFANYLWSALGIDPTQKKTAVRPEKERPVERKRPRPRLRA
jgi:predicted phage tail protein